MVVSKLVSHTIDNKCDFAFHGNKEKYLERKTAITMITLAIGN